MISAPLEHIIQKGARQEVMREKIDGILLSISKAKGLQKIFTQCKEFWHCCYLQGVKGRKNAWKGAWE